MDFFIYGVLAAIITVIIGILTWYRNNNIGTDAGKILTAQNEETRTRPRPRVAAPIGDGGPRNRAQASRNANARARMRVAQAQRHQSDSEEDEGEEASEDITLPDGKIGKKKLAKLQMKAEKKANREAEEREREEKKERDEMKSADRRAREQEKEKEEAIQEEEERLKREEEERKDQEEYEKMKIAFQVEEEGYDEDGDQEKEANLLKQFVDYIKETKVVVLEDLASTFQMKTQAVIDRISDLQKNGTLTGVIDDRGKFIYITLEELENVAKFIKQRGRITIPELAEASNSLINVGSSKNETEVGA